MNLQYSMGTSYFTHKSQPPKQYPYLTKNIKTDIAIIGGGVTASLCGYYLSKNNINAVILEKNRIGHGSTSITTSLLQYELDANAEVVSKYTTMENIEKSYKLGIKALDEISEFIDKHGNECEFKRRDTLSYTAKNIEVKEMQKEYEFRKQAGLNAQYVTEENKPFGFNLKAGVIGKGGGAELDPYLYAHQLLKVGSQNGLRVYENTEVLKILYKEDGVEIETQYGYTVTAKKVILATGYDVDKFTKHKFGLRTLTYNIVTKPLESLLEYENGMLIRDNCDPYNYYRTTFDKRIIAGGLDVDFEQGIYNEDIAKEKYSVLLDKIKQLFPEIKGIETDYAYCGCFASTDDDLGFVGEDKEHNNLWYCLGYGANGILFAILGAMMLTKLYNGEKDENLYLFSPNRFDK